MDRRKKLILNTLIKEHIKTGAPVGSGVLVENYQLGISPATVRNEMAVLENEGYILQPHTSAGRIPTEKAYHIYLEDLKENKINPNTASGINKALGAYNEIDFKNTAKFIAGISNNAVFWAYHKHNSFYTGVSSLLQQPEFRELDLLYGMSSIIDRIDEVLTSLFDKIEDCRPQVLLGSDNPFGNFCGTILSRYKHKDNVGIFGILGPMRMNYARDLALIKYINHKLIK